MDSLAPLPVAIPLVMAALLVVLEKIPRRWLLDVIGLLTVVSVVVVDLLLLKRSLEQTIVYWFGGWRPWNGFPIGIAFVIDPASATLALLVSFLSSMALLFSCHYFKAIGSFYHTLMLLFLAAMEGFCLSGDLFNMFVFFELMGVAAYALTGYEIEDTGPLEGALNFAVMNSIGAFMFLFGIGIIYSITGGLNLAWAGKYLQEHGTNSALLAAFVLLTIGFLIKGAMVPFHFWLADAHAVAPTPASILFSGVMVELGLYAVARLYWSAFRGAIEPANLDHLLVGMGILTALVGAFMALIQRHFKRLLAFSTISHSGMILMAIGLFEPAALAGGLLYIVGHGLVKGALFMIAGILLNTRGSVDQEELRGKGRQLLLASLLFFVSALALCGLPPFGPFSGKAIVEETAKNHGWHWISWVYLASSAITGAAILRFGLTVFVGIGQAGPFSGSAPSSGSREPSESYQKLRWTPVMMWLPLLLLVAASFFVGYLPAVTELAGQTAARFSDTAGYQAAVLQDQPTRISSLVLGSASRTMAISGVVIAMGMAFAALYLARLRGVSQWLARTLSPLITTVRTLHSGYVGDYIACFMLGAALMLAFAVWP